MAAKNSEDEQFQSEIDDLSASVGALCELLAAAQNAKVSAACVHAILKPMARRLDVVASTAADAQLVLKNS
ncbi:MAG: hypothetical protein L0H10_11995 [Comamonas sp.]|uniref:hypothetical protein n=1 Tax=Comamonas TaxID=283 RepID=UPI00048D22E3|nr:MULTISPECIES: hypothetical protein [Comamonas]MDN5504519.1 hypothetical protein [Comamonas sp.]MDN5535628.1 hypothetical protein [Comamonas sp.]